MGERPGRIGLPVACHAEGHNLDLSKEKQRQRKTKSPLITVQGRASNANAESQTRAQIFTLNLILKNRARVLSKSSFPSHKVRPVLSIPKKSSQKQSKANTKVRTSRPCEFVWMSNDTIAPTPCRMIK
jgi:hypothetical protein